MNTTKENQAKYKTEIYTIKVRGKLGPFWFQTFDSMDMTIEESGQSAITTLTGPVADQAVLYGMLSRIRDMGLFLLLVRNEGNVTKE